ncbi:MAG TPA: hypothetical protein VID95_14645 [Candidatus Limnocylindrales bacterium]
MARWRRRIGYAAMTLVTLVVAHNLVFVLAYGSGYNEALAHTGHDGAWSTAVVVVISSAFGLLGLAFMRLARLVFLARSLGANDGGLRHGLGGFGRDLAVLSARLAVATTGLFVIQENLEHLGAGEGLPGLSVLGSAEYPDAVLVIGAIALLVAAVASLFRWQRDVLGARILKARHLRQRPLRLLRRPRTSWVELRHASIVAHQFPGRAPPHVSTL